MEQKENMIDLVNKWARQVNSEFDNKYIYKNRPEILERLILSAKSHNISYEEVKRCKNHVVMILTTEKGRKGIGKHKGWKERVSQDFDEISADLYIDDRPVINNVITNNITAFSELVTTWAKDKFGKAWNKSLNNEACTIGSGLYLQFMTEYFFKGSF